MKTRTHKKSYVGKYDESIRWPTNSRVPNADWKPIRFVATCSKHDCGAGDCWYDRVDSQGRKDIPTIGDCEAIWCRFILRAKFTVVGCNDWEDCASPQLILNLSAGIVYLYVRLTLLLLLVNKTLIIHISMVTRNFIKVTSLALVRSK